MLFKLFFIVFYPADISLHHPAECSVILNYQLEIVADESVTSIDHYDEFYVNLLFDRSIYRLICTPVGDSAL